MHSQRLVICTPFYRPHIGGMEFALGRLATALRRRGLRVDIETSILTPASDESGVHRNGATLTEWATYVGDVIKGLNVVTDQAMLTSFGPGTATPQLEAAAAFRRQGGRVLWRSPTADHAERNLNGIQRLVSQAFSEVVVNSRGSASRTLRALPGARVHVIANLLLDAEVSRLGAIARRPPEGTVAWAGRVEPRKNPRQLSRVLNNLAELGIDVHAQPAPSIRREAEWADFIDSLDSRVHVYPPSPVLAPAIERAAVFFHTSRVEGSPNSVLEAMVRGQAVIVSDIPECKELIKMVPGAITFANERAVPGLVRGLTARESRTPGIRLERHFRAIEGHREEPVAAKWFEVLSQHPGWTRG